jgi:Potential Queuosine, Q, salvage protein family
MTNLTASTKWGESLSRRIQDQKDSNPVSDAKIHVFDPDKMNNVCQAVRSTCRDYTETGACREHVTINRTALAPLAARIRQTALVQWDEEQWHYAPPLDWPESVRTERVAGYILALDAINFCFWPTESYEYVDLATTLTRAAQSDHDAQQAIVAADSDHTLASVSSGYVFTARNFEGMTVEACRTLMERYHPHGKVPPDLDKRCRLWNEVGKVLQTSFGGSVSTLLATAQGSAPALVQLLVEHFDGFRDCCPIPTSSIDLATSGTMIHFYKRAQICVGDWNAALSLNLSDMDQLTTFADYRVPQLLRHYSVLVYASSLAANIDARQELGVGTVEEVAIRACTVTAVELLVQELSTECNDGDKSQLWTAVTTDWYLWQVGERMQNDGALLPHHRVHTIYY